ncbi:MAG: sulfite exporter TauE/SafE family protein [Cyclobacteriaceae bacterium]
MMEIIGYLASIAIGIVLGLLGGGGSILSIPILVYLFHVDAVMASAYSLFIVGVTSLAGAIPKYKDHLVNIQTGILFGLPSIVAIFVTRKWVMPAIPDVILHIGNFALTKRLLVLGVFAFLMIVASYTIIRGRKDVIHDDHEWRIPLLIFEGMLIGFLTGLVGAGGGFLIIPALVWLTGLHFKTAVGTSLFIIAINSLLGFLGDVLNYKMEWDFLLSLTTLAVFGILIGNKLQKKIPADRLRLLFGWLILAMGIWILFKELFSGIRSV